MKKIFSPKILLLAIAINMGLIFTIIFTEAILVSDHKRTIIEWILTIFYFPQTISFAVLTDLLFGGEHQRQIVMILTAFFGGLPSSLLYSYIFVKLFAPNNKERAYR